MSNLEQALQLNLFEELDALPKEFEDYTFSEEYEKYIKRLFDKMRGDKMHRFTKKTTTIILIAAILLALIIVGFAATVGREFVIKTFSDHFEYSITDRSNSKTVNGLQVEYIPNGYDLEFERNDKNYFYREYRNDKDSFSILKGNLTGAYDSDLYDHKEEIQIDYITYVFIVKNGNNEIIWNDGNYMFVLEGTISKDELLEIAQQIS